ncbi:MAG: ATP-dependent DNA helicase RecG [Peptoclostridium sp.]|uniref:ATP-dependent DNA helicase RecG n=1 Tax=Peptoclostridium sp. TaxID=1904860 RepID=UPI00139AE077|nr:ATP-dependent DNA helicase RecG [Peptoclostridium sp.]MZQ76321.1 ATP-dependent DNA helicase RecG [Peptoclostridium sp.]
MKLSDSVQAVNGVGPQKLKKLNSMGISTIYDLLYYFPRAYEDRSCFTHVPQLKAGEKACIKGRIAGVENRRLRKNLSITRIDVDDNGALAALIFFNRDHLTKIYKTGQEIRAYGTVKKTGKFTEIEGSVLEFSNEKKSALGRIVPVYPSSEGLSSNEIGKIANTALGDIKEQGELDNIEDSIPKDIMMRQKLCSIGYAIENIHAPSSREALKIALYRLIFEELFLTVCRAMYNGSRLMSKNAVKLAVSPAIYGIIERLPFGLTHAQERTLDEIFKDMQGCNVMNRLIQGDVGSGKTVVAGMAMANCVLNGFQSIMMAPTEVLARQHYSSLKKMLVHEDMKIRLLTGSTSPAEKVNIYEELESGKVDILVGTHALIQPGVKLKKLGLAVADEQHRFGVRQRLTLSEKGESPHFISMSATPIPRSLALAAYADMDISIIDELPKGRKSIETRVFKNTDRKKAYTFALEQLEAGRQAYVVCPLIEATDEKGSAISALQVFEELKSGIFKGKKVSLLHGRLPQEQKQAIMTDFESGAVDVLVATTVIEVGIDVKNASVIIIEGAEQFGLSQLHQLRGRVGRGEHNSYCMLIQRGEISRSERLNVLVSSDSGFEIAEKDLQLRGPGEIAGLRQHGHFRFRLADISKHVKILESARACAKELFESDPELSEEKNAKLKASLEADYEAEAVE